MLEHELIKEEWDKISSLIQDEENERKALQKMQDGKDEIDADAEKDDDGLSQLRQKPTSFPQESPEYWRALANTTVRTYITLLQEAQTTETLRQSLEQTSLNDIQGTPGKDCVMVFLDPCQLGEAMGPGCQPYLRKRFSAEPAHLRKLVHGCLLARGAQKRTEKNEATCPIEGDVFCLHAGFDRNVKDFGPLWRLESVSAGCDCESKEILLTYQDESIRGRKRRVKGTYTCRSNLTLYSRNLLIPNTVPERTYKSGGYNSADVISGIVALSPSDMWHTSRKEKEELLSKGRVVSVTDDAAKKKDNAVSTETVFSNQALPVEFFRDFLKAHSCKALSLS